MPVRVAVTAGTTADCTQAVALIDGISAQFLLADRGYDSNEIIDKAIETGCEIVIPPKRNRKAQRCYDKTLYRVRHLVENAFLHLKRWRSIATSACLQTSYRSQISEAARHTKATNTSTSLS